MLLAPQMFVFFVPIIRPPPCIIYLAGMRPWFSVSTIAFLGKTNYQTVLTSKFEQ